MKAATPANTSVITAVGAAVYVDSNRIVVGEIAFD